MEELLSRITESFPNINNKAAWCMLMAGGITEILSVFVKPLRREDRLGHPVARMAGLAILGVSLIIIVFDLSLWWLLPGLVIPPVWLGLRWYSFAWKLKQIHKQKKDRDIQLHDYVDSLTKKRLFEWEIRRFLLPSLTIYFKIGAIKRLKTEIGNLEYYQTAKKVNELRTYIYSIEHKPQEMTEILKPKVIKRKCKPSEKDYPCYLNNLYHAAMMQEDSIGIEYAFKEIENYIASVSDASQILVEMLEAMMYRYDAMNDEAGVSHTLALIKSRKPKSFNEYLSLNDIILYYNKRHDNREGIIAYFDEVYSKLDEMEDDEGHKLKFRLRMVQLHFEYDYKWKEISIQLFKDAEYFLSYSQDIAMEYAKMVAGAMRDALSLYGQTLLPEQERYLILQTIFHIEHYLQHHKAQVFECSDEFLYWKRDAYRLLIDIAHIKSVIDKSLDVFIRQLIESYDKIIELCLRNEEKSEYVHTIMAYIDDIIVQREVVRMNMANGTCDGDIFRSDRLIQSVFPRIKELFDTYKSILFESNFDRSFAYYTLYASHFSMCFGNGKEAEFFLSKFEEHSISVRNYRASVQCMYHNLKSTLGRTAYA